MSLTPKQIQAIALYAIARGAPIRYHKIAAALNAGLTVLADLRSGAEALTVRDVRGVKLTEVLTIEGWRQPLRVWTKEQPELPFSLQVQLGMDKPLLRACDALYAPSSKPVHACGDPDCIVPAPAPHKRQLT